MTRNDKLLDAISKAVAPQLSLEITRLRRNLKKMEAQRDDWKARALDYRKRLLEKK